MHLLIRKGWWSKFLNKKFIKMSWHPPNAHCLAMFKFCLHLNLNKLRVCRFHLDNRIDYIMKDYFLLIPRIRSLKHLIFAKFSCKSPLMLEWITWNSINIVNFTKLKNNYDMFVFWSTLIFYFNEKTNSAKIENYSTNIFSGCSIRVEVYSKWAKNTGTRTPLILNCQYKFRISTIFLSQHKIKTNTLFNSYIN